MCEAIAPDIEHLPEPHRTAAAMVLDSLLEREFPPQSVLDQSCQASKSLTRQQWSLMAFIHSWRGDQQRAFSDAHYAFMEYRRCA
jgi:hypothetical protein